MQLGLIGLGKMGKNMRERIRRAGIEVIGYDRNPEVSDVASLDDLVLRMQNDSRHARTVLARTPAVALPPRLGEARALISV